MKSTQLPAHWTLETFGDLAKEFLSGGTPATDQNAFWRGQIPWTTSAPIAEADVNIRQGQRFITQAGLDGSASHLVPKGSLLVGTRVGVGKAVVNEIDVAISQDLTAVVIDPKRAMPHFLAYQFKTAAVQRYFEARRRGTTIKGVSRFDLEQLQLLLPPLPEQRAIARALRAVQEAKEARQRELALERERKAALMEFLFTHGARGQPVATRQTNHGNIPQEWQIMPLDECAFIQTGIAKGRKLKGTDIISAPYLRVANVQDGYLNLSEMKTISLYRSELGRYRLQAGDVVLTEGGDFDKLGRGFVWRGEIVDCVHQNHIFAVRANPRVLVPEFLSFLVQSPYGKSYFLSVAHKTTNLACINKTKLGGFPTLVPTIEEQRSIAHSLIACDAKIAKLGRELQLLDELFQAMLEELLTGLLSAVPLIEQEAAS